MILDIKYITQKIYEMYYLFFIKLNLLCLRANNIQTNIKYNENTKSKNLIFSKVINTWNKKIWIFWYFQRIEQNNKRFISWKLWFSSYDYITIFFCLHHVAKSLLSIIIEQNKYSLKNESPFQNFQYQLTDRFLMDEGFQEVLGGHINLTVILDGSKLEESSFSRCEFYRFSWHNFFIFLQHTSHSYIFI